MKTFPNSLTLNNFFKNRFSTFFLFIATLSLGACKIESGINAAACEEGEETNCTKVISEPSDDPDDDQPAVISSKSISLGLIQPAGSTPTGGITIEITGTGFRAISEVYTAGQLCTEFKYVSSSKIKCRVPRSESEIDADVEIYDGPAYQPGAKKFQFKKAYSYTFKPIPLINAVSGNNCDVKGSNNGSCKLFIQGSGFRSSAMTFVGGKACLATAETRVNGDQSISCEVPSGFKGKAHVKVIQDGLTTELKDAFTYTGSPSFNMVKVTLEKCAGCHAFVSNFAGVSQNQSNIWNRIGVLTQADGSDYMGNYLTAQEIQQFKDWIDGGGKTTSFYP